jgi:hypothetical protein
MPRRVDALPMDAPDHSLIDHENAPAAFQHHFERCDNATAAKEEL